jgi:hypothetical protein
MMLPIYAYMLNGLAVCMYLDIVFAFAGGLSHAAAKPAAHD